MMSTRDAPVAQLDRALPSEGKGHTFRIVSGAPFRKYATGAKMPPISPSEPASGLYRNKRDTVLETYYEGHKLSALSP
jgi:hypothetical protein